MHRFVTGTVLLILAVSSVRAEVVMETIDYGHDGAPLRGYLFYDDAVEGTRPGVLVIHEWWGNNAYAQSRARQLAALGYVAFAADMYGPDKTTDAAEQAQAWATPFYQDTALFRARAAAGLKVLAEHRLTHDRPLAAIGYCFGGSAVLQLACADPDRLAGVVSFHGSPIAVRDDDPTPIRPAVLVCNGADDPLVDRAQLDAMIESFRAHEADVELIDYPGAVHSFTNPDADGSFHEGVRYQREADEKSWRDMRAFFDRVLGG